MGDPRGAAASGATRARRRRGRRALLVLLVLLVVPVLAVGGYAWFLSNKLSDLVQEDLLGVQTPASGAGSPEWSTDSDDKPLVTGKGENYLIIGSDARPGDAFSRSDVIIVAHVTEKKDAVTLIHFPRDLYVEIPGRSKDKINAAYAFGGAPLLVRTLQNLIGVTIDHAAKIDFEGFTRMIDAVGGIQVWAEEPSTAGGVTITRGWNKLDGAQALIFVRERKSLSEGDISRGWRQMEVVRALFTKAASRDVRLNPVKLSAFLDATIPNMVVDRSMTPAFIRSQALSLGRLRSDRITFATAPFTGYGTAPDGGAIVILDEDRMGQLRRGLERDDLPGYFAGKYAALR